MAHFIWNGGSLKNGSVAQFDRTSGSKWARLLKGYTEDGIRYIVYEIISFTNDKNEITPFIVVSKTKTYMISYEGHITPPATFSYSGYESDWNTNMSGTLYLKMYNYDIWPHFPKSTNATYEGTIVGTI